MVSPSSAVGVDRRFERPGSHEFPGHLGDGLGPASNMRRESVDSRINQGLSDMRLGGSPYTSNNQSTSSIQSTLHNQRNPRVGMDNYAAHRISNGYQPSNDRNPESKTVRTAPAITGPATGTIARAAEPTKGQAWAFPEEEIKRVSHYDDSRRSSITDSIASSQFTTESRLPTGQRRLEDSSEFARMSGHSSEFPSVHHHTMQHKQLSDLQAEEGAGGPGAQPYSRTPELRVSHKLAERKRRTEMKELFDQLRDLMPQERGSKASKWEILTKGKQRRLTKAHLRHAHANCVAKPSPSTKDNLITFAFFKRITTLRCQTMKFFDVSFRLPRWNWRRLVVTPMHPRPLNRRALQRPHTHFLQSTTPRARVQLSFLRCDPSATACPTALIR